MKASQTWTLFFLTLTLLYSSLSAQEVSPEEALAEAEINRQYLEQISSYEQELANANKGSRQEVLARLGIYKTNLEISIKQKDSSAIQRNKETLESYADEIQAIETLPDSIKTKAYLLLAKLSQHYPENQDPWDYYKKALNILAQSTDLENARNIYFNIFQDAVDHIENTQGKRKAIPHKKELDKLLSIAQSDEQKTFINHLYAQSYSFENLSYTQKARANDFFEEAINYAKNPKTLSQVLFDYAQWSEKWGRIQYSRKKALRLKPDYSKAIQLYQQIIDMECPYLTKDAEAQIAKIKSKKLSLEVENTFFPGTETFVTLRARNIFTTNLLIYPLQLTTLENPDILLNPNNFIPKEKRSLNKADNTTDTQNSFVKQYTVNKKVSVPYYPYKIKKELGSDLPSGAYILKARSGEIEAQERLFITNNAMILQAEQDKIYVYACKSNNGTALVGKTIRLWIQKDLDNKNWLQYELKTDSNGMAKLELENWSANKKWKYAAIILDDNNPAMLQGIFDETLSSNKATPIAHINCNASEYLPSDKIHIKGLLSSFKKNEFKALSQQKFYFSVYNSYHKSVFKTEVQSNENGIIDLHFTLPELAKSGNYSCEIRDTNNETIYNESIFKVTHKGSESYHYKHTTIPGKRGRVDFYPGEHIRAKINLNKNDGTPLINKKIHLQVYSSKPTDKFEDAQLYKSFELKTDTEGHISYSFKAKNTSDQKTLYTILAQVKGDLENKPQELADIIVSPQAYKAHISSEKNIYQKGQNIKIQIQCLSDSKKAIRDNGELKIIKDVWTETWGNSKGERLTGEELRELDSSESWLFWKPSPSDYRLENIEVISQDIETVIVNTDINGKYTHSFQANESGYYRVIWLSRGNQKEVIQSESSFWVISEKNEIKGYRSENLQIIPSSTEPSEENKLSYLISSPIPDISVLIYIESNNSPVFELVKLSGYSALKHIQLPENYTGQIKIHTNAITNGKFLRDFKQFHVKEYSPESLKIHSHKKSYQPGENIEIKVQLPESLLRKNMKASDIFLVLKNKSDSNTPEAHLLVKNEINPFLKKEKRTSYSFKDTPFYTPNFQNITKSSEQLENKVLNENKHFINRFNDNKNNLKSEEKILWEKTFEKNDNGEYSAQIILPNKIGKWTLEAFIYDPSGKLIDNSIEIETKLPVLSKLTTPSFLTEGDKSEVELLFINNLNEQSKITINRSENEHTHFDKPMITEVLEIKKNTQASKTWKIEAKQAGSAEIAIQTKSKNRINELSSNFQIFPQENAYKRHLGILQPSERQILYKTTDQSEELTLKTYNSLEALLVSIIVPIIKKQAVPSEEIAFNAALTGFLLNIIEDRPKLQRELEKKHQFNENRLKKKLEDDLEKLFNLQKSDGSWSWLAEQESSETITANILWTLHLLKHSNFKISSDISRKSIHYISSQLLSKDIENQALLLNSLTSRNLFKNIKSPSRLEAKSLLQHLRYLKDLSPEQTAYLASAAMQCQLNEELYILKKQLEQQDSTDIPHRAIKLLIAIYNNAPEEEVAKLFTAIVEKRNNDFLKNRFETLWLVYALNEYRINYPSKHSNKAITIDFNSDETVEWNIKNTEEFLFTTNKNIQLDETNIWDIQKEEDKVLYYTIREKTSNISTYPNESLHLTKEYIQLKQIPTLLNGDTSQEVKLKQNASISQGEEMLIKVHINAQKTLENISLIEKLPAGFQLIESSFKLENPKIKNIPMFIEKNLNQLNVYLSKIDAGEWIFSYKLQAETPGSYQTGITKFFSQSPQIKSTSEKPYSLHIISKEKNSNEKKHIQK